MTYRVVYTDQFIDDINRHVAYLRSEHAADRVIERWYEGLFRRLDRLGEWPGVYPIDEAYSAEVGRSERKMNFGDYLVFYRTDDKAQTVTVDAFIHGATRH